ncbi:MAG: DUF1801 domain-containing protein [Pseudomonadales bacterium]|nr:DUF1801 domain-containing protein [Pseudomonadales bacterium]
MDASVKERFDSYPGKARSKLIRLRKLILQTGAEYKVGPLEESLKWGEPSYSAKGGSAVRIDWKPKFPDKCFVFFQCQTKLIETFKEIYGDTFEYEGKRAIVLTMENDIPAQELKHCIYLSLQYHKLKHLPLLGA